MSSKRIVILSVIVVAIIIAAAFLLSSRGREVWRLTSAHLKQLVASVLDFSPTGEAADAKLPQEPTKNPNAAKSAANPSVDLTPAQLNSIKIEPVGAYEFPVEIEAVGNISFADEQSVQVFPPYQGTIIQSFVQLGAHVEKDQPLYTIKSPDLIQAESTMIGAAATFELTTKELERVKGLPGVAQREVEQAISDQQTADGALKAARQAVRVFGKTEEEIDQMIASRKIDPALVVRSPIAGQVTSYNAPPGLLVQPGNAPAPYTIANLSIKWMLADVIESDIALLHLGQGVQVKVMAYPNRMFKAKVTKIYPAVNPNTHRETIRSDVEDPKDELRPGMLANFVISVDGPKVGIGVPANGVVREPDGTMTVWVTTDRHHFEQRVVKTGLRRDDRVQIISGLRRGELVVTDGAVFLSNMVAAQQAE
ncbi:MAG TPA: efflux RND transporter periplasmic adaptor subunit [Bryobacteraceae bacterium]|jgi:cobalt-zinc-cadmium efflux system membrane fusion protein|nr:efflux RND transporter periplasmic adaptor subunit [Bryobacteraceae bacterium]